jgi:diguanylate cyclase (GGDEF)-like protein/PAS domain S-box-containing protein
MIKNNYRCLLIADYNSDVLLIRSTLGIDEITLEWMSDIPETLDKESLLKKYDVIILDLDFWKDDFIVRFNKLKDQADDMPIIVLNSVEKDNIAFSLNKFGAWDTITKPQITKKVLLQSIRHAVAYRESQEELKASEMRFKSLSQFSFNWEYWQDPDGSMRYVSPSCEEITGYTADEFIQQPSLHKMIIAIEDKNIFSEHIKKRESSKGFLKVRFRIRKKDGNYCLIEHRCQEILGPDGKYLGLRVSCRDLSELRIKEQLRNLSMAVEQSPASIIITNIEGTIEYVNQWFVEKTGYTREDVDEQNVNMLKSGQTPKEVYKDLWETITSGKKWMGEIYNKKKNGELFWEYCSISPIVGEEGDITHFLAVKQDITAQKEEEKILFHRANYDTLTDLPNRSLALYRIDHAIAMAKRENSIVGVMFVDLDHFKIVNDTLGHEMGDALLKDAAKRLQKCCRESDTVARFGGDEFLVVMPSLDSLEDTAILARRILEAFQPAFQLDSQQAFVGLSIGITGYPNDGNDAPTLLRNADSAMYHAKEASRNTYRFFTQEMNSKAIERMNIEASLRSALKNNEFVIYYQPIMNMRKILIGLECLLRWDNPELGMVAPNHFIPLAEETGLINDIGKWMLDQTTQQVKEWMDQVKKPLRLAINISSRQFRDGLLIQHIEEMLEKNNFPAHLLELEITERMLLQDAPETTAILNELSQMGVRLSIDDFGTGYSSLSYLKKYPFTTLKIDKAFVNDVLVNDDSSTITKTIISMGHSLKLEIIGEGVEEPEQLNFLKQNQCDLVQGFYFSKPVPADKFARLLYQYYPIVNS